MQDSGLSNGYTDMLNEAGRFDYLLVYFRMLLDIRESVKNMQKSAVASHQMLK